VRALHAHYKRHVSVWWRTSYGNSRENIPEVSRGRPSVCASTKPSCLVHAIFDFLFLGHSYRTPHKPYEPYRRSAIKAARPFLAVWILGLSLNTLVVLFALRPARQKPALPATSMAASSLVPSFWGAPHLVAACLFCLTCWFVYMYGSACPYPCVLALRLFFVVPVLATIPTPREPLVSNSWQC